MEFVSYTEKEGVSQIAMDDGSGFNKEGHFRTHTTTTVCCKRQVTEHGMHA